MVYTPGKKGNVLGFPSDGETAGPKSTAKQPTNVRKKGRTPLIYVTDEIAPMRRSC